MPTHFLILSALFASMPALAAESCTQTASTPPTEFARQPVRADNWLSPGNLRFGLIHADMRLANLLVDGERTVLLDFDDSGFGWFLYDLAASLSFYETSPQVPALIRAWLTGYLEVRALKPEDIRMIDAMILRSPVSR